MTLEYHKKERTLLIGCMLIASILLFLFQKDIVLSGLDDNLIQRIAETIPYREWIRESYYNWSGRIGANALIYLLVVLNLNIWKALNALMICLLAYSINRIFKRQVTFIDFLFVLFTFGLISQRILTSSTFCFHGSFAYLWPFVAGIFSLIPLADIFFRSEQPKRALMPLYLAAIVYSVLSNEQIGLVLFTLYGLYVLYAWVTKKECSYELYGFLALIFGLLLVVLLAPGNAIRYQAEIKRWYPDFNDISFALWLKRNIEWFFEKFFIQQWRLVILLGGIASYCHYKVLKQRNYVLEILVVTAIAAALITDLKGLDDWLFAFKKDSSFRSFFPYLFWSVYLLALSYSLVKIDDKWIFNLILLAAGISSMLLIWFSPTIYGSGNRVLLLCSIILIILINKLRLQSQIMINRFIIYYGIFSVINMLGLLRLWGYGFEIYY